MTRQDLNQSQEILLKDESKNRGKVDISRLAAKEGKGDEIDPEKILDDQDLKFFAELSKYQSPEQLNDYATLKKLKAMAAKRALDETKKLNFWQLYMRTAPLINIWTMTTFLYPRFARVTLIFVSIYLHSLFCALFFQAIYGKPVLQTAVSIKLSD